MSLRLFFDSNLSQFESNLSQFLRRKSGRLYAILNFAEKNTLETGHRAVTNFQLGLARFCRWKEEKKSYFFAGLE